MSFNFGTDQNDLMLTMVSFASQHEFFNLLELSSGGTLAWLAYTAGLIGFIMLVFMPESWNPKHIIAWFILFLVVLVRPLGEPLFFTDPAADENTMVDSTICFGNVLDSRECQDTMDGINVEGLTAGQLAQEQVPVQSGQAPGFKVFTPQAAVIDVINNLHYGIATQLNDLGPRVLDKQFAALETMRRNSTGNTFSAYSQADFLSSCGARDPEMARVAAMASDQVMERYPDLWTKMSQTQLVFADGIQLFKNFDTFRRAQTQVMQRELFPTLVCAPGKCNDGDAQNAFDVDPDRQITAADLELFKNSILYDAPEDFVRVATPGTPPDDEGNRRISGVDETNTNLSAALSGLGEDAVRRLLSQKVSLIVPLNVDAALRGGAIGNGGDLSPYRDLHSQIEPVIDQIANAGGTATELAVSGGACAHVRATDIQPSRQTASGLERLANGIGRGLQWAATGVCDLANATGRFVTRVATENLAGPATFIAEPFIGPKVEFDDDEPAYIVANCAQMHMVGNLRHNTASADLAMFNRNLAQLLEDNEEILAQQNFEGLTPRDQIAAVLNTIYEARARSCDDKPAGAVRNACIRTKTAQLVEMRRQNQEMSAEASRAAADVLVQNASEVDYVNPTRDIANTLGEWTAPFFIGLKAMIGGFGSGTYSEIMPRIVSFAVSLMIILTPLIFMIGLLMPTWSFGILVMSVVVIAYFLLTKVVFTMISIIMSIFIAARQSGVVSYEIGNFADLVVGSAYTSAFILTGLFMFSLKNPLAAIQQVAGAADKASTVSGAEALAAVATVVKGAKVVGGLAAGGVGAIGAAGALKSAGGAAAEAGTSLTLGDTMGALASGFSEGKKGGLMKAISGESTDSGYDAASRSLATSMNDREDGPARRKDFTHYQSVDRGARIKADQEDSKLIAKATGNSAAYRGDLKGGKMVGNQYVEFGADASGESLASDAYKAGHAKDPSQEVMKAGKYKDAVQTKVDFEDFKGRIEHTYDINTYVEHSSLDRSFFEQQAQKGNGQLIDSLGNATQDIEKAVKFLRVESEGVHVSDLPNRGGGGNS